MVPNGPGSPHRPVQADQVEDQSVLSPKASSPALLHVLSRLPDFHSNRVNRSVFDYAEEPEDQDQVQIQVVISIILVPVPTVAVLVV